MTKDEAEKRLREAIGIDDDEEEIVPPGSRPVKPRPNEQEYPQPAVDT